MGIERLGDMLHARRVRLGISLEDAAHYTNIRKGMLTAFEKSDYAKFPSQGHAKGMLSSYAHFLTLDSNMVLSLYEEEYAAYEKRREIKKTATNVRRGLGVHGERLVSSMHPQPRHNRGDGSGSEGQTSFLEHEHIARHDDRYKSGAVRVVKHRLSNKPSAQVRRLRSDSSSFASRFYDTNHHQMMGHNNEDAASKKIKDTDSLNRSGDSHIPHDAFGRFHASTSRLSSTARTTTGDTAHSTEHSRTKAHKNTRHHTYTSTSSSSTSAINRMKMRLIAILSEKRTRMIALAVFLLIMIVVIVASYLIVTAGNPDSGLIETVGAGDTKTTETSSHNGSATIRTMNGYPVDVEIAVEEGGSSSVDVSYDDGELYSITALGPWQRQFQVTESMTASFSKPDVVTVTANGQSVDITKADDGTGQVTLKVNFIDNASAKSSSKSSNTKSNSKSNSKSSKKKSS